MNEEQVINILLLVVFALAGAFLVYFPFGLARMIRKHQEEMTRIMEAHHQQRMADMQAAIDRVRKP